MRVLFALTKKLILSTLIINVYTIFFMRHITGIHMISMFSLMTTNEVGLLTKYDYVFKKITHLPCFSVPSFKVSIITKI